MSDDDKKLLILTVGQGTKSPEDIVVGLRNTVAQINPRRFWLISSISDTSQQVTELVAEDEKIREQFAEACEPIENPFKLEPCRLACRKAIRHVKESLEEGEKLFINPTSGTKQMSAGAVIAALNENIGIVFTEGERGKTSTVMPGTEKVAYVDSSTYFRERDIKQAEEFFNAGDFSAAKELLKQYKQDEPRLYALVSTCLYWQNLDYKNAASDSARCSAEIKKHLDLCLKNENSSIEVLKDIVAWAEHALQRNESRDAFLMSHKAFEYAVRYFVKNDCNTEPAKKGLSDLIKILKTENHKAASLIDQTLHLQIRNRNETIHQISPITQYQANLLYGRVNSLLCKTINGFCRTKLPTLEDFRACTKLETNF